MQSPSFTINRFERIIAVRLVGVWDQSIDLRYLSQLGEVMQRMRQSTWGVIVDFRQWHVSSGVIAQNVNYSLHFDRRNQTGECWLTTDDAQTKHLEMFFENLHFSPQRVADEEGVYAWAEAHLFSVSSDLKDWLENAN